MIEFASITKVEISATKLTAYIELSPEAPLFTSMDLEATTRVYNTVSYTHLTLPTKRIV